MTVVAKICDLQTNELADISPIALEKSMSVLLAGARGFTVQAPANHALLTSVVADDGLPNLPKDAGDRKLLVWEDGEIIFHGRIFKTERIGDGLKNRVTITAWDAFRELGFDSEDQAGRVVRGSTNQPTAGSPFADYDGNFINPKFASSVGGQDGISGPDLALQILTNSQNTGPESDPTPGEGPLPIDLITGTFDLDVPPAIDLNPAETMAWPKAVGDFLLQLIRSGVCDVAMRPIDPAEGLDPYAMVAVSAVSSYGTDRSADVHFHYWTGDRNAAAVKYISDFGTVNNKLYDFLGPFDAAGTRARLGNITPGSAGTTIDPTASRARFGTFFQIRVKDTTGETGSARPLYIAEWNAEQGYRIFPRDLLYITPAKGAGAMFQAPASFDRGDTIALEVEGIGISLAESQRVYGYTRTWSREDVPEMSELLTSADVSLA